jgi:ubiquinone biosynthesis protein
MGITQTIRNVSRLREIMIVFARNGFAELIQHSKILEALPGFVLPQSRPLSEEPVDSILGHRLRLCCEELGPAFIKFGQLVGTREDFFDAAFVREMKKLQDDVKSISWEVAIKIIESSLGKSWNTVFATIQPRAIASASMASVFRGTLLSGEDVVLKIKRPGIEDLIERDFELLDYLFDKFEKNSDQFKYLGLSRALKDIHETIKRELNLTLELYNLQRLSKNFQSEVEACPIKFPIAYPDCSSSNILVMEYLDGVTFNKLKPADMTEELKEKLLACMHLFLTSLLKDGVFHADLHGGNFMLLKDQRIGVIDFGLVGTLSKKNKTVFMSILFLIVAGDWDSLAMEIMDVSEFEKMPVAQDLSRDLEYMLAPYLALNAAQINTAEMFKSLVKLLTAHKLFLPREWTIIFRALATLDGVGRSLGLDVNTFSVMSQHTKDISGDLISKEELTTQALWVARDMITSMKVLPKHILWFFREFSKKGYAFDHKIQHLATVGNQLQRGFFTLSMSIAGSCFFFMGAHFASAQNVQSFSDLTLITIIFWVLGAIIFLMMLRLMGKKR